MPRYGSIVRCVLFTPDGRWFATGSWDGSLRIYEVASGRLHAKIECLTQGLCVAPDGCHLAVCDGDSPEVLIYRLDLRDPDREESQRIAKLLADLGNDSYAVRQEASKRLRGLGLIAVPEVDRATQSPSAEVRIRSSAILADIRSLEPWVELKGHCDVLAVAFSPDGKILACGDRDGDVQLWDVAGQKVVATLRK
jgi:WD40 repeat protein